MTERRVPAPHYEGESNIFNGQEVFYHKNIVSFARALVEERPARKFSFYEEVLKPVDVRRDDPITIDQTHAFVGQSAVHKFTGRYEDSLALHEAQQQVKAAQMHDTVMVEGTVTVDQTTGDIYQIFEPHYPNSEVPVEAQLAPLKSAIEHMGQGSLEYFEREARTIVDFAQGKNHHVVVMSGDTEQAVYAIQDVQIKQRISGGKNNSNKLNKPLPLSKQKIGA